jgi:hypothetical protein
MLQEVDGKAQLIIDSYSLQWCLNKRAVIPISCSTLLLLQLPSHLYTSTPWTELRMSRRSTRPPTIESLLPPILDNLTSSPPNPYSAHQKALTTTARLVSSKHYDIAIEICMNVSRELLKLGEAGSGVELAVRGLGIMGDNEVEVDEKTRGM